MPHRKDQKLLKDNGGAMDYHCRLTNEFPVKQTQDCCELISLCASQRARDSSWLRYIYIYIYGG